MTVLDTEDKCVRMDGVIKMRLWFVEILAFKMEQVNVVYSVRTRPYFWGRDCE